MGSLTFDTLRDGNTRRLPLFKNAKGEPAHNEDGSNWSDAEWLQAVVGELGEYANLKKKVERGDFGLDDARFALADELADVVTYIDILAFRLGINLGHAVESKWNRKSAQLGIDLRIGPRGVVDYSIRPECAGACAPECEGAVCTNLATTVFADGSPACDECKAKEPFDDTTD